MVTTRWVIVLLLVLPMAVLAAELGKLMYQQNIFAPIRTRNKYTHTHAREQRNAIRDGEERWGEREMEIKIECKNIENKTKTESE